MKHNTPSFITVVMEQQDHHRYMRPLECSFQEAYMGYCEHGFMKMTGEDGDLWERAMRALNESKLANQEWKKASGNPLEDDDWEEVLSKELIPDIDEEPDTVPNPTQINFQQELHDDCQC